MESLESSLMATDFASSSDHHASPVMPIRKCGRFAIDPPSIRRITTCALIEVAQILIQGEK